MRRGDLRTFALAGSVALVVATLLPGTLTDGDSCVNAALARDMAHGGWRDWVAPHWALAGSWTWYVEHPPGGAWGAALLGLLGLSTDRAPVVANALWMVAAAAGVAAIVRRFRDDTAPLVAGVVLLLHVAALKYVQRASLEFPIAACTAWTLAGALRLRDGRRWVVVTAAALAGAFLVRGVFGGVGAALFVAVLLSPGHRPPPARWLVTAALAALPLVLFDRLHAAATGSAFWPAYLDRQVVSSLVPGGTQHSGDGRQVAYFATRLVLYALPWALLPAWCLVRRSSRAAVDRVWWLLLVGVGVTFVGAALTTRPASRYLFAAWPCLAALFGLTLPRPLPAWVTRSARIAFVVATPLLVVAKTATDGRDAWVVLAERLHALRDGPGAPREVRGPFDPQDARDKAFLRWHLGVPAIGGDAPQGGQDVWNVVRTGEPVGADRIVVAETPFGALARPEHSR